MVNAEYLKQIEKARRGLRVLIFSENCAPLMLRLALHDALTYDPTKTIKGGPNGSIRNEEELNHNLNRGLKRAVNLCEKVKSDNSEITYADLYQLAGIVAVEMSGGPTIDFIPGRKDSTQSPEEGRLPKDIDGINNPTLTVIDIIDHMLSEASQLRKIIKRMALEDKDMVALFGGLNSLGMSDEDQGEDTNSKSVDQDAEIALKPAGNQSGTQSSSNLNPGGEQSGTLNQNASNPAGNQSVTHSSSNSNPGGEQSGTQNQNASNPPEKQSGTKGQRKRPLKFDNSYFKELLKKKDSNNTLFNDNNFRKIVDQYANDEDAFFADYAAAHKSVSLLGRTKQASRIRLAQIGIAVAATVILGYFLSRRRNK